MRKLTFRKGSALPKIKTLSRPRIAASLLTSKQVFFTFHPSDKLPS